ncbi:MAG: hypothetical protein V7K90_20350 [Nostoc sp.]|uniref:hypothetical protein n=1 Tax=Nostoc sp. TaxID=1180 RepID=UPI002FF68ED1
MLPIKKLIISLSALSFIFASSNALAQQRNVKSSCRLYTTAGLIGKGRCTIKTYIEGNYIMVEVYKSWEQNNEPDRLRFTNRPDCISWQWKSDNGCEEEFWYGDGWSYVSTREDEENGKTRFIYSLGSAYYFQYDGSFPRP